MPCLGVRPRSWCRGFRTCRGCAPHRNALPRHPGRLELRGQIWGYHGKIHGGLRGFQWGSTVKAGDQMEIS